jgi:gamma-glutamylcyclotransferase (GGCT)/AIG2-like uncharacterized protein YtfP
VYGTLRSGGSHASLLDGFATRREPASTRGVVADSANGYPVATFGGDAVLEGELVWLRAESARAAFRDLDEYEGEEFRRVAVEVTTRNGVVLAYAYEGR